MQSRIKKGDIVRLKGEAWVVVELNSDGLWEVMDEWQRLREIPVREEEIEMVVANIDDFESDDGIYDFIQVYDIINK